MTATQLATAILPALALTVLAQQTAPSVQSSQSVSAAPATAEPPTAPVPAAATKVILVRGADGEPEYAAKFDSQLKAWQQAATSAGADISIIHSPIAAPAPGNEQGTGTTTTEQGAYAGQGAGITQETDADRLRGILTSLPPEGTAEVWLVLMGHGTWDGKEARFNLEGPDVSAAQLAEWLKPLRRPLVLINAASCSAPFLNALAGPNRIVVTATRSGSEKNYARFGEYLASALGDPASDYDGDGQQSLLEWVLTASARTAQFYKTEGRIASEHALIDDNGDGRGTPLEWFQGLRAIKKSKDNVPVDGDAASHLWLIPDDTTRHMPTEKRTARDTLEAEIAALRAKKTTLKEDDYYRQLENLLRKLAAVYE